MKILAPLILALLAAVAVSGCADNSHSFNSPDQQRAHAEKAQGELSSDTNKK